jgi:hypothetical protein
MNVVETPQSVCRAGFARADVTPPVGIYHRMWGAATHDRATGVHKPLLATVMWVGPAGDGGEPQVLIALDHCVLDGSDLDAIREKAAAAAGLESEQVLVTLSHTHGSGWLSRTRVHLPGGELIGPYLDRLAELCGHAAMTAAAAAEPAVITYGTARCPLAAHRDYRDPAGGQTVCGFNPAGPADDTVLVAKATADSGELLGTVVNYACHPTTLAWENTLISPDYVGAMREVVEGETGAPCLFLQGASGDLGPREGYTADVAVAERNGVQLAFAALGGLYALPRPNTRFEYAGPVLSGAVLGTWEHRPLDPAAVERNSVFRCRRFEVDLPFRSDLPDLETTRKQLAHWQAEEQAARAAGDADRVRDCRARVEQMTRQIARLTAIPAGKAYPLPVTVWHLGGAVWVFTAGELYQYFQMTLRNLFPDRAVVVATITNDWQPGYVPVSSAYGHGIYQEVIAAVAPGSLEALTDAVTEEVRWLLSL